MAAISSRGQVGMLGEHSWCVNHFVATSAQCSDSGVWPDLDWAIGACAMIAGWCSTKVSSLDDA